MRKTIATVVTLVLVWLGYTAWPLYDLLVLVRAMENRDVGTVTRHVYFDAVRMSLTQQVVAAYVRRTKINISPFAQSMASVLRFGYCSGAGVWSLSPCQRIFRTCSGMSWPRPCERQCKTGNARKSPALWFAFPAVGGGSTSSPQA